MKYKGIRVLNLEQLAPFIVQAIKFKTFYY